jgi:hypothetical protein
LPSKCCALALPATSQVAVRVQSHGTKSAACWLVQAALLHCPRYTCITASSTYRALCRACVCCCCACMPSCNPVNTDLQQSLGPAETSLPARSLIAGMPWPTGLQACPGLVSAGWRLLSSACAVPVVRIPLKVRQACCFMQGSAATPGTLRQGVYIHGPHCSFRTDGPKRCSRPHNTQSSQPRCRSALCAQNLSVAIDVGPNVVYV